MSSMTPSSNGGFIRKLMRGNAVSRVTPHLFTQEHVRLNFSPADKWQALDMLLDVLFGHNALPQGDEGTEIRQSVHNREKMMSTGIGQGIAIPHTKTDEIDSHVVAIGISPEGIDFDALDGEPVHITILLVSSTNAAVSHVQTLANISKRFIDPAVRDRVMQAKTPEQVVMTITRK